MDKCAFDLGEKCAAMTERKCPGCHFFKTQEELKEGRDKAAKRVASLDPDLKQYIRHKYYGDRRRYGG